MNETLQHLIFVRHGESEGDVRRAAYKRGESYKTLKTPEQEELTLRGEEQSRLAGQWIQEHIINKLGLISFDGSYVSSSLRSEQSAAALDLSIAVWQDDQDLDERNRGKVRGLRPKQHRDLFPESYLQMNERPLHWIPPGGESILQVAKRAERFMEKIEGSRNVLTVGHRDWIWAAMLIIERLTEEELAAVDTDAIQNAQIIEYTSINPHTRRAAPALLWKRSVNPVQPEGTNNWQILHHIAELYDIAA